MKKSPPKAPVKQTSKTVKPVNSKDLLDILDRFIDKHHRLFFWIACGLGFLFSLLLWDSKISLTGDDSFYILRASDFIHSFKFPGFQGPLYPMALSLVIALAGVNITAMKALSLLAMMLFLFLFYRCFYIRIPSSVLFIALILASINSYLLYYSSQTYTEAFYLMMEMVLLCFFFNRFIGPAPFDSFGKQALLSHLLLALLLLSITLTKNIGLSAPLAVFAYFLFQKQWKALVLSLVLFGAVFLAFQGVKYLLWPESGFQVSSQGSGLMNKDYYNPQAGKEDFSGMVKRLYDNSNQYFSKHLLYMNGLRTYDLTMKVQPFWMLVVVAGLLASLALFWRRNKFLFFTALVTVSFLGISFLALQAKWDQNRLIIPALPFIVLLFMGLLYELGKMKKLKTLQFVLPLFALVLFFQTLASTTSAVKLSRENSGKYGGLTPDWKNYLKASEWAAQNLGPDDKVACRKPSMSFVYAQGKEFYGIMQLPTYSNEAFARYWQKNPASIVLADYKNLAGKPIPKDVFADLKKHMYAILISGDSVYLAERFDTISTSMVAKWLNTNGVTTFSDPALIGQLAKVPNGGLKLMYPDSLLLQLKQNNVTHMLTANLRRNSTVKDGMIVNTVERYMAYIQEKYPEIFTKVTQVGADDDEPAVIYRVDYSKAGK